MKSLATSWALLFALAPFFAIAQEPQAQCEAGNGIIFWAQEEEYAFLGIISEQISAEKARKLGFDNSYGSYISRVVKNTAAERAGLRHFDYIYGLDEYRTAEGQSLPQILRRYAPNQKAAIHFIRQGEKRTVAVTLGRKPAEELPRRSECERAFLGLSPQGPESLVSDGVAITTVGNSTAEEMGLKDGDRITAINGHTIADWRDIAIAIDNMEVGHTIVVKYQRHGKTYKASRPIKSLCDTKSRGAREAPLAPQPGDWFNRHFKTEENGPKPGKGPNLSIKVEALSREEAARAGAGKISTDNNLRAEELSFYSEPGSSLLRIKCYLPETADTELRLFNAAGRVVYEYSLGSFSGLFNDEIDILQNGAGVYYLEIRQGRRSLSKKISVAGR